MPATSQNNEAEIIADKSLKACF